MACAAGLFLTFTNESLRVYIQDVLEKEHGPALERLDATHYLIRVNDQPTAAMYSELIKRCTSSYFERVYKITVPKDDQSSANVDDD